MTSQRFFAIVATILVSAVNADELVDRADANGDGSVSLYELRAAYYADVEFNRRIEQSFAEYDTDGDGLISETERRMKRAETATESTPATTQTSAALAATAATAATAKSVPVDSPGATTSADGSGDPAPAISTAAREVEAAPPYPDTLSRSESLILEIDADNSGGASIDELVASGDGRQWFTDKAFESADVNDDDDLDPDELEVLLRSLERRRR
jgi:hypothetical protein